MRYYLYAVGKGYGCDYTIGCNLAMMPLDASTIEGAQAEAKRLLGEDHYADLEPPGRDGFSIETASILCVAEEVAVPLEELRAKAQAEEEAWGKVEAEKEERTEYERLKAKFKSA